MWSKDINEVLDKVNSSMNGLTSDEANKRLDLYGKNEIPQGKKSTILDIVYNQFKSPIILILIVAAILAIVTGSKSDSIFIIVVIVINAVIGTYQEWNSEKSAEKLQNMIKLRTKVLRDQKVYEIDSERLVVRRYY